MIIIRLMGGLGNQLFQYAVGRKLSLDRQVSFKLDLSWYATQSKRAFQLDRFKIRAQPATRLEIQAITHTLQQDLFSRLFRLAQRLLPYYRRRLIYELRPGFDPNILKKTPRSAYLDGYWQSERYFAEIGNILREDFCLVEALHPTNTIYAQQICSGPSVSLHVRRGDYLEPRLSTVYHLCDADYYRKATELILRHFPDAHFFVFSEDLEWARQNLAAGPKITYIENNSLARDWETIYLMSLCRRHIIANSSFSWWGAWLSENPDKMVIAPAKWFLSPKRSSADLVPEEWIRI